MQCHKTTKNKIPIGGAVALRQFSFCSDSGFASITAVAWIFDPSNVTVVVATTLSFLVTSWKLKKCVNEWKINGCF